MAKVWCADVAWVMQVAAFVCAAVIVAICWHALLICETYAVDVE